MNGGGARRDGRPGDGRIEHTRLREVIKTADWILDLGPEGGVRRGGGGGGDSGGGRGGEGELYGGI